MAITSHHIDDATQGQPPPDQAITDRLPQIRRVSHNDWPTRRFAPSFDSAAAAAAHRRLPYLPGLDGLRAVAVGAVLIYHAGLSWLPGGFLGVEVFFVISGYLITALLLAEWEAAGRISLPRFWLRRARRLLPAVAVLLVATLAVALVVVPGEVASLRADALAAAGYVTNWWLITAQQSYFEAVGRPSLLRHLWSLAIEEQFYLLWPVVLSVALRRWPRRAVFLAAVAGAAASTLLMALLYHPGADPSRLYYGTDTRAAGLLAGAALAMVWTPWRRPAYTSRAATLALDLAGLAAVAALLVCFVRFNEFDPALYRGGFALLALLTTVVIAVVVHPRPVLGRRLLGWAPLRWVGLRSYSLYLWHWPVFMLTRPQLDLPLDGAPLLLLRLAVAGLLAEISYRWVETPIRRGALGKAWHDWRAAEGWRRWSLSARWAAASLVVTVGAVQLAAAVAAAQPPPPPDYLSVASVDTIARTGATATAAAPTAPPPAAATSTPATPATSASPTPAGLLAGAASPSPVPPTPTARAAQSTAAPRATATPRPDATVRTHLNLRTGPGTAYDILRVLAPREGVMVLGRNPDGDWYKVRAPGGDEGWVFTEVLDVTRSRTGIPVAEAPPPPTPTPTPPPAPTSTPAPALQPSSPPAAQPAEQPAAPAEQPPAAAGAVVAVGDSVMVGAAGELQRAIPGIGIDAAVGRHAAAAIATLQALRDSGQIGDVVVVHIGSNGPITAEQFDQLMAVVADVPRVVIVTATVPRAWEAPNNAVLVEGASRYPNAVLVDWHGASAGRPEFFWNDGIHLRPEGAHLYARMIASAVNGG